MRSTYALLAAIGLVGCSTDKYRLPPPHYAHGQPGLGSRALHAEAVRQLDKMRETEYAHVIVVDEDKGVFKYDCSGFVGYALTNVAPEALATVNALYGTTRPNVLLYVEILQKIPPGETRGLWHRMRHVENLLPGDLVAWLATDKKKDYLGNVNSGHIVFVDGPPREIAPGEWEVPVLDATSTGHGPADRRRKPDLTGLGRGTIMLYTDDGLPKKYRWGNSPLDPVVQTEIVMGRVL